MKRHSQALTELLNQESVRVEDYWAGMAVVVIGLTRVIFVRKIPRSSTLEDEIHYQIAPLGKSRVHIIIAKVPAVYEGIKKLVEDVGDLRGLGFRKRLIREVSKIDWTVVEQVERDLPSLPLAVARIIEQREPLFLEKIGDKTLLSKIQEDLPEGTAELLDAIDSLLPAANGEEASHSNFTFLQLSAKTGLTEDAVRGRFSPLIGKPYLQILQRGRGNLPYVFRYLKEKRWQQDGQQKDKPSSQETDEASATETDKSQHRKSTQQESAELVRYGERPKGGYTNQAKEERR